MSVSSTEHLDKLAFILYDRPAGRNIIGYAIEKIEQLRADNERLRAEIERLTRERDNAREAVELLTKDLSQRFAIRYQTSAGCMCPAEANLHCQNSFCPRRNPPGVITCQGGKP